MITGFLKQLRDQLDRLGQVNLEFTATTAVVMSSNTGLIHTGDKSRTTSRANWSRHVSIRESEPACGKRIHMRRLDGFFSVAAEVS